MIINYFHKFEDSISIIDLKHDVCSQNHPYQRSSTCSNQIISLEFTRTTSQITNRIKFSLSLLESSHK